MRGVCLKLALASVLLVTASCAKVYSSPANPRGWKAARAFSEDLLAKLELKSGRHRSKPDLVAAGRSSAVPAPEAQPVRTEEGTALKQAESTPHQQLALPALALCLLSALLGWLLRGAEARLALGPANVLREQLYNSPASQTEQPENMDLEDEAERDDLTEPVISASEQPEADQKPALEEANSSHGAPASAPLNRASGSSRGSSRKRRGRQKAVKPHGSNEPGGTSLSSGDEEQTATSTCSEASGFDTPTEEVHRISEGLASPKSGPSPGWLKRLPKTSSPAASLGRRTANLDAVDDMTLIMAALAERLSLDVDSMLPPERMQLLQMALQCCQHRESSWLHAQANEIRFAHARTAQDTLQHKKDRTQAEEALREMEAFRGSLEDGLLAGLALMLGTLLACGVRCGYLGSRLGRCCSLASLPPASLLRPWAILEFLGILACWGQATSDALLACCIMLGTAYAVVKGGVLGGSTHAAPQLKLAIGLGLICGLAGYLAVGRLGGDATLWLSLWEAWICMHVIASWQLEAVHKALSRGPWASTRLLLYQGSLSMSLPLMTAILPFDGCFSRVSSVIMSAVRN